MAARAAAALAALLAAVGFAAVAVSWNSEGGVQPLALAPFAASLAAAAAAVAAERLRGGRGREARELREALQDAGMLPGGECGGERFSVLSVRRSRRARAVEMTFRCRSPRISLAELSRISPSAFSGAEAVEFSPAPGGAYTVRLMLEGHDEAMERLLSRRSLR